MPTSKRKPVPAANALKIEACEPAPAPVRKASATIKTSNGKIEIIERDCGIGAAEAIGWMSEESVET